ncbi:MRP family ATP-binding protein [Pseudotabrizicola sediminis]|uniref:Iron-sulfur cluster carrier protein n=1 Tax=Pseudotabrizicola sediminis TaxID=2486418 RepID=A0ABY2KKN8_9RHOB|nr:Mrp/NBP35 family ATP-binding protein [Pseudotabrizicola sediminis]TGD41698.1 MRP family ATP-binding protein [Pseudotabrizicola sediminis]
MTDTPPALDAIRACLTGIALPEGGNLISADRVRALAVTQGTVTFVIEAADAAEAQALAPVVESAECALRALPGITSVNIAVTAHAAPKAPPNLTIGRHPEGAPQQRRIPGVKRLLAIGSGKGGVGKSTVSSNLAVAMARQGWKVGLLDADIYGPSVPTMLGVTRAPASPDGKVIIPLQAHGISFMSIGNMLPEGQAVIWRGPMLMGALQQLLMQVRWGDLDVLIVDMPPGTGDVQLTLCTHFDVTGAIVVSTPQDVALIDAQKALTAFKELKTEVIGLIENMSTYVCRNCGHEEHIFGHGGVAAKAVKLGLPLLAELPLSIDVRLAGDAGKPIAAGEGPVAEAYGRLAARLIAAAEAGGQG